MTMHEVSSFDTSFFVTTSSSKYWNCLMLVLDLLLPSLTTIHDECWRWKPSNLSFFLDPIEYLLHSQWFVFSAGTNCQSRESRHKILCWNEQYGWWWIDQNGMKMGCKPHTDGTELKHGALCPFSFGSSRESRSFKKWSSATLQVSSSSSSFRQGSGIATILWTLMSSDNFLVILK